MFEDEDNAVIVPEVGPQKRPAVRACAWWNHLRGTSLALLWLQNEYDTGCTKRKSQVLTIFLEIQTTVGQIGEVEPEDRNTHHLATTTGI